MRTPMSRPLAGRRDRAIDPSPPAGFEVELYLPNKVGGLLSVVPGTQVRGGATYLRRLLYSELLGPSSDPGYLSIRGSVIVVVREWRTGHPAGASQLRVPSVRPPPSYWKSSVIMILKLIELGIGAGKLW